MIKLLSTCHSLAVVQTALACVAVGTQTVGGPKWPLITPQHQVYEFKDARTARVDLDLKDNTGKVLYHLQCRNGLMDERDFVFSGDFECRLVPLYEPTTYSTLLTDDPEQSRDWQSRGRFLLPELIGTCGNHRITVSGGNSVFARCCWYSQCLMCARKRVPITQRAVPWRWHPSDSPSRRGPTFPQRLPLPNRLQGVHLRRNAERVIAHGSNPEGLNPRLRILGTVHTRRDISWIVSFLVLSQS
jgi:hypothetical protein